MKRGLGCLSVQLGLLLMAAGICCAAEWLTGDELSPLLDRSGIFIIDLRTGEEWNGSALKIQHAVHEDPAEVPSWAAKYSKDALMVLYCA